MSKGSKQRPTNKTKYDQNYDDINWSKKIITIKKVEIKPKKDEDNTRTV